MPPASPLPPVADSWAWQLLTSGGVPGMLLLGVLLLLSLAALALAVEQFLTVRASRLAPETVGIRVRTLLEAGDLSGAARAADSGGMLGAVLNAAIEEAQELSGTAGPTWPAVEKAMEDAAQVGAARLMRRIDYLAVIGNLAPMVGLLGTVVGMIFAFREVAATQGAATAGELASGIYQALVTTVGGLLVAIPSLAVYAVLRSRVEAITADVAAQADTATRPLKRALWSDGARQAASPAIALPAKPGRRA
ncbi:MotA/TolQ/ExbB proton channel family protein [Botrimarina sp.]|uniref:MotA/TolQ/ExbB proton channel family protein n=1 Tax=Botrimarina sp. TaxID=2795802 RepID=UPI0032ECBD94